MTLRTQVERGEVNGRQITVIDTPGQLPCTASLGYCPVRCLATALEASLHSPAYPLPTSRYHFSRLVQGPRGQGGRKIVQPLLNWLSCPPTPDTRVFIPASSGRCHAMAVLGDQQTAGVQPSLEALFSLHGSACNHQKQHIVLVSHCSENGKPLHCLQASCTQPAPIRRWPTELEAAQ